MDIQVLKFGGTSMNDHQTWKNVLEIIKTYEYPVVVVSATAKTTRQLIEAAKLASEQKLEEALQISASIKDRHLNIVTTFLEENPHPKKELILESCIRKLDEKIGLLNKLLAYTSKKDILLPSMKDAIAAIGEQISSYLLAQCGLATDQLTQFVDARKLIKTDANYGSATPNSALIQQKINALETILDGGFTPIIGGFYGETHDGTVTTLGFEGSDYSASLLGGALHAKSIEIWTDVSGIYTSDPRFIETAKPIEQISYFDATELAYFGAKVLHPSTLKPAQERNIPVFVKNMFHPQDKGTQIVRESNYSNNALAISIKDDVALLTINAYETLMGYEFLTQVFTVLQHQGISVDAVNTTEASVTIALANSHKLKDLSRLFIELGSVDIQTKKGLITIIGLQNIDNNFIGEHMLKSSTAQVFDMISFTLQKRIMNLVLNEDVLIETTKNIHVRLFE